MRNYLEESYYVITIPANNSIEIYNPSVSLLQTKRHGKRRGRTKREENNLDPTPMIYSC